MSPRADHPNLPSFPTRRSSDLAIGALAAWQRDYFKNDNITCAKAGTIAATIAAGPLNYAGVNPKIDRKSTRLNSSHVEISYAVFCLKKKKRMPKSLNVAIERRL